MSFNINDKEPLWGKWRIGKELGEGAFGKVWEVYSDHAIAAVKQIDILYSQIDEKKAYIEGVTQEGIEHYYRSLLESSLAEIKIMKCLRECENIVAFHEHEIVEDSNGWHILILMELLNPFCKYQYENEVDIKTVLNLGIHICNALDMCRKHHILHRDIKPDNIFYSNKDCLFKLGDFGIAVDLNTPTAINGRPGTLTHMSPEVYCGKDYTYEDDVYALGVIIYRLLNFNRLPLMPDYPELITPRQRNEAIYNRLKGAKIPLPALCNVKNKDVMQVNSYGVDIAYKLCNTARKAISENKLERYKTAEELRNELEAISALI
ncbi:MAG: serine/threonine-protein kinase [Clostridia bacterium]|nr:serine/threonine-protein kinase [Clostridia bacterium]MBP3359883.1 serine/threonine-protein kinase [Clostridia bacterium]